jgi:FkbM family methyltransferase
MRNSEVELMHYFFEKYKIKKSIYLDVGACVGELTFPFANFFEKIYSFEPNRESIKIFKKNNKYNNIFLIEKALNNENTKIKFGGFGGELRFNQPGIRHLDNINEMNTILVNDEVFLKNKIPNPLNLPMPAHNSGDLIYIDSVNLETFVYENNIDIENISFIKMDIEGGEKIVIPNIINILDKYKIPLYLELHTHVLQSNECIDILEKLFEVYFKRLDENLNDVSLEFYKSNIQKLGTIQLFL